MKTLKYFFALSFIYSLLPTLASGQQWIGNNNYYSTIWRTGNIGVGTSSVSSKFHVYAPGWNGITVQGNNTNDTWLRIMNGGATHYIFDDGPNDGHNLRVESKNALAFHTNGNRERMRITTNGNLVVHNKMSIGTSQIPSGYRLAVDGRIICEELKVKLSQSWPDYVFGKDYELPTLEEVDRHIRQEGHLPGIPAAAEIEADGGIDMGEMQRRMMEKIEELTLYVIELNKANQELREKVNHLENR